MTRLCITLAPQLMKRIRSLANEKGLTISDMVRRAIEAYLDKHEAK